MGDKNKALVVTTKSIFDKIKNFFKNIFGKKNTEENPSDEKIKNAEISERVMEEIENSIETDVTDEKSEFFKKYNDFKEGKISASDFEGAEKVRLNLILNEELNISTKKLEQIQKMVKSNN